MEQLSRLVEFAPAEVTRLHPDYVWKVSSGDQEDDAGLITLRERVEKEGADAQIEWIRRMELKFIHDPKSSGLDLLGPELSEHFRGFTWSDEDFPGGTEGPNEVFADVMVDALDLVIPERRANRSRTAVALREEVADAVWDYVTNQWAAIPEQRGWMLNRHAVDSFVRMRRDADNDGVDLVIRSAHRHPEVAKANAARAGNSNAVASFSSHSLGLAIDFELSHRDAIQFQGLSTRPMSEVVRMRESPVYKWLALRAHLYGWYPYQNEPWHWEYNPPGFRKIFWAEYQAEPQ